MTQKCFLWSGTLQSRVLAEPGHVCPAGGGNHSYFSMQPKGILK